MNILLAIILAILLGQFALMAYFVWRLRGLYASFLSFIQPEAEGKPSPLAIFCQSIADMAGRSIVAGIKTTFMGKQSGDVRAEKAVKTDIALDSVELASPLLGSIIQSYPTLTKSIRRHPELLDVAIQLLARRSQGKTTAGNGSREPVDFKL